MDNRRSRSKRDRRRLQCKCFCPDPYICSRLSFFLHCLCDTDCALLLAYPQKKIQSRCLDENCRFRFCIGGLSQTRFVLDFHSVYTAGCTFNNCGFSRRVVFFDLFVYSKTKARPYSRTLKYIGQFLTASSI